MRLLNLSFGAAILAGLCFLPVSAQAASEDEKKKICAQAEERYQKLIGKPSADEDVTIVKMYKYNFCPRLIEVKKGATVRWVNVDRRTSHSVWLKEVGKEESDRLFSGETVEITMDMAPGEYTYLCGPHWKEDGMVAKVKVVD